MPFRLWNNPSPTGIQPIVFLVYPHADEVFTTGTDFLGAPLSYIIHAECIFTMAVFSPLLSLRSFSKVSRKANYPLLFYNLLSRMPRSPEHEIKLCLASLISSLDRYTSHGDGQISHRLYLKWKLATKNKGKARNNNIKIEEDKSTQCIRELHEALV